jgi:hypothetical protein
MRPEPKPHRPGRGRGRVIFGATAVLGFIVGVAGSSRAFDRRQSASFCHAVSSSRLPAGSNPVAHASTGVVYNTSTDTSGHVICPVKDDEMMRAFLVAGVNVHGRDDVTTAQAGVQACVTPWTAPQAAICGTQATSGASFYGEFTLQPSVSAWSNNASAFPYLYVVLPQSGAGNSQFRGFWFFN